MKSSSCSMPRQRGWARQLLTAAAILVCATAVVGAPSGVEPLFVRSRDLKWVDTTILPPGSKIAVLQGDPTKEGLFTIRAKMPAGYKIPAHWHPTDENVTVLSGALGIGMGDKLDRTQGRSMAAGNFMSLPAKCHHFAWTTRPTIIQVHAMGPFEVIYINPADDPRNRR
jgi:quercetin dioxygenase-like cupin family protein